MVGKTGYMMVDVWFPVEIKGGYLLGSSMFRASASSRITRFMYSGQYSLMPSCLAAVQSLFKSSLSQIIVPFLAEFFKTPHLLTPHLLYGRI